MPLLVRHALTIAEVASRWDTSPARLAEWAVGGALTLSIIVPAVEVVGIDEPLGNLAEAPGGELWPLFRHSNPLEAVLVRRVRPPGALAWGRITEPKDGLVVTVSDVHVTPGEVDRFERSNGLGQAVLGSSARSRGGRPPGRDWTSLYGWAARRVHDRGLPASQGELVREALDWLSEQGEDPLPDESTVRRRLAGFWRALNVSPSQ